MPPHTGSPSGVRNIVSGQPPCSPEQMQRIHVDLVDVGPLFAIDFDVDEQLVHHARGGFVLEAFVRHDMAPVTRCVADRQQDRPIAALGLGERVRSPRPPVHRIMLVLQQIRRRLRARDDWCGMYWLMTWELRETARSLTI